MSSCRIRPTHDYNCTDLMTSRFKGFGAFGSKRTSSQQNTNNTKNSLSPQSPQQQGHLPNNSSTSLAHTSPSTNGAVHTPQGSVSSTTSLPMNQNQNQSGLGRPPSYTYNPNAPRAASPLPPGQQMAHHPPPLNTGAYPQGQHPALAGGGGQPPGYGGYGGQVAPQPTLGPYGRQGQAVEVEGAGRSKAQLIVGIDFVRKDFSEQCRTLLMSSGNYLLWCCFCICHEHRS